jgi:hypothetical protein
VGTIREAAVDDGSGCVVCVLWARAPDGAANHEWPIHHVQLGKLLWVQGRPTIYREELQLNTLAFRACPAIRWLDERVLRVSLVPGRCSTQCS